MFSPRLWLAIAAVSGLAAGLILISLIFQSADPYKGLSEFPNRCLTQALSSCQIAGELPATWEVPTLGTPPESCFQLTGRRVRGCADLG